MKTKNISKYILNFIKENKNNEKLTDNWKSKDNLIAFEKLLKKEAKSKDINKPKRGKSSFLYFCDDFKSIVKKDVPDHTNKQLLSYLGVLWKEYKEDKPEIIKKYEKIAEKERDRYKKEMLIYKENIVEDQENEPELSLNILKDNIEDDYIEIKEEVKKEEVKKKEKKEKKEKKVKEERKEEKEEVNKEEKKRDKKSKDNIKELDDTEKGFDKYIKKRKNKFIEEYPELNGEQLFQKMKKKWGSLSDEKKQKYRS